MKKTEKLGLNQWERTDPLLMSAFNENFSKLEGAVSNAAQVVYGSYVGNGKFGDRNPVRLDFAGKLSRPPMLVYVTGYGGGGDLMMLRGNTYQSFNFYGSSSDLYVRITWTDTGVQWYSDNANYRQLNSDGQTYYYIAIA